MTAYRLAFAVSAVLGTPVILAMASFQQGHGYWAKAAANYRSLAAYWARPAVRLDTDPPGDVE